LLVIRLARTGRAKYPTYRIVAAESARAATGRFIEILGHYNPHTKELVIKHDETLKRLSQGAQPSNTVVKLLTREKLELPAWVKLKTKVSKATAAETAPGAAEADTEVSPAEADADADAAEADTSAEKAPALEADDVRVAEVADATGEAALAENAPNINATDTAESEEAAAQDAVAAQDAGATAAGAEPKSGK
jgi:small subunit ribosomal protein S16